MVHFDFVIVIDFDYSYRGVLLFWILQKLYDYEMRSYFYLTSFAFLFVLMSLLVELFDSPSVNFLEQRKVLLWIV